MIWSARLRKFFQRLPEKCVTVKTMNFFLFLLAFLAWTEAAPSPPQCGKIRGSPCREDSECACLNRHNKSSLICNTRLRCEKETFVDQIQRRQPCHRIYKTYCEVNTDCPCGEARLICEDHECVKEKKGPRLNKDFFLSLLGRRVNGTQSSSRRQRRRLLRHEIFKRI